MPPAARHPFHHLPDLHELVLDGPPLSAREADCGVLCRLAVRAVSLATLVPDLAVLSPGRGMQDCAQARAIAMYLAHVGLRLPMAEVAQGFCRHRSSVAHACAAIEECREAPDWDRWLDRLEERIRSAAQTWETHMTRETTRTRKPDVRTGDEPGLARVNVEVDGVSAEVLVDLAESPLAWLARRRGRDGRAMIEPAQLMAGERLRLDFTRALMTPRMTADWSGTAGRNRGRAAAGGLQVSEAVLAAKDRLSRALDAAGPEFAGPLLDVCCFLKGIEQVEQERGWPARAGKVVLCLGLDRLARHYGLSAQAQGPSRGSLRAWVAEDGRARVDGLDGVR